jgi:hypothetical protein
MERVWRRGAGDGFSEPASENPRHPIPSTGSDGGERDAHLLLTALAILLLSTLDAIFTLLLMDAGVVTEANPFMAALIETDLDLFARTKTILTATGVVVLVALVNRPLFPTITHRLFPGRRRFRVRNLLEWILLGYLVLIGYHFALILTVILD